MKCHGGAPVAASRGSGAAVCWKSQRADGWVGLDGAAREPPASLGGHSMERVLALPAPHLSLLSLRL